MADGNFSTLYTDIRGDAKTAFIPLTAKAWDAQSASPILGDTRAAPIVEALRRNGHDLSSSQMPPIECKSIAIRARQFDRWANEFLAKHTNALVLHLGCGLDTRADRIERSPNACWIDVDLPEMVALRKQIMTSTFRDSDYRLLEADATKSEWLQGLPRDRLTIVIMEGLLSYFTENQAQILISRLTKHLSHGEICFDCISSTILKATKKGMVKSIQDANVELRSAIDDLEAWKNAINEDIDVLQVIRFVEIDGVQHLPMMTRLQMYIASWIPGVRDSARLVRLGFGQSGSSK